MNDTNKLLNEKQKTKQTRQYNFNLNLNINIMRTETKIIGIYKYNELSEDAKENVVYWLNKYPIEYETDEGVFQYQYYDELDDEDVSEHCEMNGYEFLEDGTIY